MVRQRQPLASGKGVRECNMARVACCSFQAEAAIALDLHPHDLQRHLQRIAAALAMRGPGVGIGMQPVMHMQRAQSCLAVARRCRQQLQQRAGIHPAAVGQQHRAGRDGRQP